MWTFAFCTSWQPNGQKKSINRRGARRSRLLVIGWSLREHQDTETTPSSHGDLPDEGRFTPDHRHPAERVLVRHPSSQARFAWRRPPFSSLMPANEQSWPLRLKA